MENWRANMWEVPQTMKNVFCQLFFISNSSSLRRRWEWLLKFETNEHCTRKWEAIQLKVISRITIIFGVSSFSCRYSIFFSFSRSPSTSCCCVIKCSFCNSNDSLWLVNEHAISTDKIKTPHNIISQSHSQSLLFLIAIMWVSVRLGRKDRVEFSS